MADSNQFPPEQVTENPTNPSLSQDAEQSLNSNLWLPLGHVLYRISRWTPRGSGGWKQLQFHLALLSQGCALELRSLLHRIAFQYKQATLGGGVSSGLLMERNQAGVLQLSKRTQCCSLDIQSFLEAHPWATDFDRVVFVDAWMAGARFGVRTSECGTLGNTSQA
jgi:hypothetical protein